VRIGEPSLISTQRRLFSTRLPSIKRTGASSSIWDGAAWGHFVSGFRHREAVAEPAQRRLFSVSARSQARLFHLGTARFESQIQGLVHYVFFNRAGTFLAFIYFEPGGRRILPCGLFIERQSEAHDWCCAFSAPMKNPFRLGMHVSSVADVHGDGRYPPTLRIFRAVASRGV
jgi:hypothetical protein